MKNKLLVTVVMLFVWSISITLKAQKKAPVLNHIAQYVVDLGVSTNFYQKIIGLDTIPNPFNDGRHTWFSIGYKSHLHLIQGAKAATVKEKNSHLCFSVALVSNFIKTLEQHKIEYENWAGDKNTVTLRLDGVRQIYFKDPDGYWVEINDAKD